MLDKYNRFQTLEEHGIELLYRGKDIASVEFTRSDETLRYNSLCDTLDINKLNLHSDEDFDRVSQFNIPQYYKDIDVEDYIRARARMEAPDTAARVEHELALFKAKNLYPMLQLMIYIVDIMRKHNIVWGVGRGSSVASYILYLIGIHKIDSIRYNLNIKEFLK